MQPLAHGANLHAARHLTSRCAQVPAYPAAAYGQADLRRLRAATA
jgi:hypothetical protein